MIKRKLWGSDRSALQSWVGCAAEMDAERWTLRGGERQSSFIHTPSKVEPARASRVGIKGDRRGKKKRTQVVSRERRAYEREPVP